MKNKAHSLAFGRSHWDDERKSLSTPSDRFSGYIFPESAKVKSLTQRQCPWCTSQYIIAEDNRICSNLSRNSGIVAACTGVIEEKPSLWRVFIVDGESSSEVHDVPPSLVLPIISSTGLLKVLTWNACRKLQFVGYHKNLILSSLDVYCLYCPAIGINQE